MLLVIFVAGRPKERLQIEIAWDRRLAGGDRPIKHPDVVLFSTGAAQAFRRAKPASGIREFVAKGDGQLPVRSLRPIRERQRVAIPVGGALDVDVKRLPAHGDAEMHGNRGLAMLDPHEPTLYDRRDDWTER